MLKSWEHLESVFSQIEDAFSITVYKLNGRRISRKKAIELFGWKVYLSGIARSAFHYTAYRETAAGTGILFDSSALFRKRDMSVQNVGAVMAIDWETDGISAASAVIRPR